MQTRLIATALGAFGLGALVSWAVTADIYEKRFSEERQGYDDLLGDKTDHIFALKDVINKLETLAIGEIKLEEVLNQESLIELLQPVTSDNVIEVAEEKNEELDDMLIEEESEVPEGETPEVTKKNLQALIDAYTADPDAQAEFADIANRAIEYDEAPPFVISQAEYAWDEEGENYAKITVKYYLRDRVVLDDEEDPVDDIQGMLGWRNLNRFGDESGDPDVVFIRNRRLNTDFEVVKEDDASLPLHVKYSMGREEFNVNRAAGLIKLRPEDDDH